MSAFRIAPLAAALVALATAAVAQIPAPNAPTAAMEPSGMPPVKDTGIFAHAILNENEGRFNGTNTEYRWDGQGWVGTDYDKLWIKSEEPDWCRLSGQDSGVLHRLRFRTRIL